MNKIYGMKTSISSEQMVPLIGNHFTWSLSSQPILDVSYGHRNKRKATADGKLS